MTDTNKTCGGCAWYRKDARFDWNGDCTYPLTMLEADYGDVYAEEQYDATNCKTFLSHADAALIGKCYLLRSIDVVLQWSDVDRLVEMLAGKPLERRKRCEKCCGDGWVWHADGSMAGQVKCDACHGTGYQGGEG